MIQEIYDILFGLLTTILTGFGTWITYKITKWSKASKKSNAILCAKLDANIKLKELDLLDLNEKDYKKEHAKILIELDKQIMKIKNGDL